jgi:hypothetical protein
MVHAGPKLAGETLLMEDRFRFCIRNTQRGGVNMSCKFIACLVGAVAIIALVAPASAVPMSAGQPAVAAEGVTNDVIQVRQICGRRNIGRGITRTWSCPRGWHCVSLTRCRRN